MFVAGQVVHVDGPISSSMAEASKPNRSKQARIEGAFLIPELWQKTLINSGVD